MAKRKRRGRRPKPFALKLKTGTLYSIVSTVLIIAGGVVILSFSSKGTLLTFIHNFLRQYFGFGVLFLPFLFITAGLMLTKLKWGIAQANVFAGALLFSTSFIILFQTGEIGRQAWQSASSLVSGLVAGLMLSGLMIGSLLILFETSFVEVWEFVSKLLTKAKTIFQVKKREIPFGQEKLPLKVRGIEERPEVEVKGKQKEKKELEEFEATLVSNIPSASRKVWEYPPFSLLTDQIGGKADRGDLNKNADIIEKNLESFGIQARVVEVNCGPAVTQYCLEIALGTKLSRVTSLSNDLALALAAPTGQIRIEAPIPGRSLVGVEIPNRSLEIVTLKKMLASSVMKKAKSKLTVSLGLNVSGLPVVDDIGRMPHVLIAGSTGSGKSVCLNSFIATLLFRTTPHEVKLILVDPKRVELTQFNGIPHLLTPVITDPEKVVAALKWAIAEMERRYKLFAESGVRNIEGYNELSGFQALPYIVIIIDELADIIFFSPSEVEDTITRIAQMARATGIHLLISTQRPSVDVITGLIKANIPCRIAFNVSSMVDSRVIIDMPGAEKLLGRGDMLYIPPDQAKPTRIQGAFVSEVEIQNLIKFLRESGFVPQYSEEVTTKYTAKTVGTAKGVDEEVDELFEEAVRVVCQYDRASASLLQRRLSIGYARAARILDQLYNAGIVSAPEGAKPRDVLIKNAEEFLARRREGEG